MLYNNPSYIRIISVNSPDSFLSDNCEAFILPLPTTETTEDLLTENEVMSFILSYEFYYPPFKVALPISLLISFRYLKCQMIIGTADVSHTTHCNIEHYLSFDTSDMQNGINPRSRNVTHLHHGLEKKHVSKLIFSPMLSSGETSSSSSIGSIENFAQNICYKEFLKQLKEIIAWLHRLRSLFDVDGSINQSGVNFINNQNIDEFIAESPRKIYFINYCKLIAEKYPQLEKKISIKLQYIENLSLQLFPSTINQKSNGPNQHLINKFNRKRHHHHKLSKFNEWLTRTKYRLNSLKRKLSSTDCTRKILHILRRKQTTIQADIETHSQSLSQQKKSRNQESYVDGKLQIYEEQLHQLWLQSIEYRLIIDTRLEKSSHYLSSEYCSRSSSIIMRTSEYSKKLNSPLKNRSSSINRSTNLKDQFSYFSNNNLIRSNLSTDHIESLRSDICPSDDSGYHATTLNKSNSIDELIEIRRLALYRLKTEKLLKYLGHKLSFSFDDLSIQRTVPNLLNILYQSLPSTNASESEEKSSDNLLSDIIPFNPNEYERIEATTINTMNEDDNEMNLDTSVSSISIFKSKIRKRTFSSHYNCSRERGTMSVSNDISHSNYFDEFYENDKQLDSLRRRTRRSNSSPPTFFSHLSPSFIQSWFGDEYFLKYQEEILNENVQKQKDYLIYKLNKKFTYRQQHAYVPHRYYFHTRQLHKRKRLNKLLVSPPSEAVSASELHDLKLECKRASDKQRREEIKKMLDKSLINPSDIDKYFPFSKQRSRSSCDSSIFSLPLSYDTTNSQFINEQWLSNVFSDSMDNQSCSSFNSGESFHHRYMEKEKLNHHYHSHGHAELDESDCCSMSINKKQLNSIQSDNTTNNFQFYQFVKNDSNSSINANMDIDSDGSSSQQPLDHENTLVEDKDITTPIQFNNVTKKLFKSMSCTTALGAKISSDNKLVINKRNYQENKLNYLDKSKGVTSMTMSASVHTDTFTLSQYKCMQPLFDWQEGDRQLSRDDEFFCSTANDSSSSSNTSDNDNVMNMEKVIYRKRFNPYASMSINKSVSTDSLNDEEMTFEKRNTLINDTTTNDLHNNSNSCLSKFSLIPCSSIMNNDNGIERNRKRNSFKSKRRYYRNKRPKSVYYCLSCRHRLPQANNKRGVSNDSSLSPSLRSTAISSSIGTSTNLSLLSPNDDLLVTTTANITTSQSIEAACEVDSLTNEISKRSFSCSPSSSPLVVLQPEEINDEVNIAEQPQKIIKEQEYSYLEERSSGDSLLIYLCLIDYKSLYKQTIHHYIELVAVMESEQEKNYLNNSIASIDYIDYDDSIDKSTSINYHSIILQIGHESTTQQSILYDKLICLCEKHIDNLQKTLIFDDIKLRLIETKDQLPSAHLQQKRDRTKKLIMSWDRLKQRAIFNYMTTKDLDNLYERIHCARNEINEDRKWMWVENIPLDQMSNIVLTLENLSNAQNRCRTYRKNLDELKVALSRLPNKDDQWMKKVLTNDYNVTQQHLDSYECNCKLRFEFLNDHQKKWNEFIELCKSHDERITKLTEMVDEYMMLMTNNMESESFEHLKNVNEFEKQLNQIQNNLLILDNAADKLVTKTQLNITIENRHRKEMEKRKLKVDELNKKLEEIRTSSSFDYSKRVCEVSYSTKPIRSSPTKQFHLNRFLSSQTGQVTHQEISDEVKMEEQNTQSIDSAVLLNSNFTNHSSSLSSTQDDHLNHFHENRQHNQFYPHSNLHTNTTSTINDIVKETGVNNSHDQYHLLDESDVTKINQRSSPTATLSSNVKNGLVIHIDQRNGKQNEHLEEDVEIDHLDECSITTDYKPLMTGRVIQNSPIGRIMENHSKKMRTNDSIDNQIISLLTTVSSVCYSERKSSDVKLTLNVYAAPKMRHDKCYSKYSNCSSSTSEIEIYEDEKKKRISSKYKCKYLPSKSHKRSQFKSSKIVTQHQSSFSQTDIQHPSSSSSIFNQNQHSSSSRTKQNKSSSSSIVNGNQSSTSSDIDAQEQSSCVESSDKIIEKKYSTTLNTNWIELRSTSDDIPFNVYRFGDCPYRFTEDCQKETKQIDVDEVSDSNNISNESEEISDSNNISKESEEISDLQNNSIVSEEISDLQNISKESEEISDLNNISKESELAEEHIETKKQCDVNRDEKHEKANCGIVLFPVTYSENLKSDQCSESCSYKTTSSNTSLVYRFLRWLSLPPLIYQMNNQFY
ncbi:hypothetical protein SNEBB_004689 [Seison nebaliae]|nr:hypothetical protein SNEBB_004689 [Seison nebaliae]